MKDTTDKSVRQLHLPVEGMTCAACVSHVEGALRGVRGISSAQVNLATERATVEMHPEVVSLGELVKAPSPRSGRS
ncbi:MAG: heavy-metal-associated domain-containing protein [Dehalococcoidia bacterium]|nr:heavy-metal-associated domain-containing protein [Dehalococcoidia bacterium]